MVTKMLQFYKNNFSFFFWIRKGSWTFLQYLECFLFSWKHILFLSPLYKEKALEQSTCCLCCFEPERTCHKRQWAAQGTDAVPEIKDKQETQEAGKKCNFHCWKILRNCILTHSIGCGLQSKRRSELKQKKTQNPILRKCLFLRCGSETRSARGEGGQGVRKSGYFLTRIRFPFKIIILIKLLLPRKLLSLYRHIKRPVMNFEVTGMTPLGY